MGESLSSASLFLGLEFDSEGIFLGFSLLCYQQPKNVPDRLWRPRLHCKLQSMRPLASGDLRTMDVNSVMAIDRHQRTLQTPFMSHLYAENADLLGLSLKWIGPNRKPTRLSKWRLNMEIAA